MVSDMLCCVPPEPTHCWFSMCCCCCCCCGWGTCCGCFCRGCGAGPAPALAAAAASAAAVANCCVCCCAACCCGLLRASSCTNSVRSVGSCLSDLRMVQKAARYTVLYIERILAAHRQQPRQRKHRFRTQVLLGAGPWREASAMYTALSHANCIRPQVLGCVSAVGMHCTVILNPILGTNGPCVSDSGRYAAEYPSGLRCEECSLPVSANNTTNQAASRPCPALTYISSFHKLLLQQVKAHKLCNVLHISQAELYTELIPACISPMPQEGP